MYQYEVYYINKWPFIRHKILRLPSATVLHNAPGKNIAREYFADLTRGEEHHFQEIIESEFSESELIQRAGILSSKRRYNLVDYNCHRFIEELTGAKLRDNQLVSFGLIAVATVGLIAYARRT